MNRVFLLAALTVLAPGRAGAEFIFGLTNLQQLVTFDSDTRTVTSTTSLPGFNISGQFLTSIDVRPATGQLYALSNQNNLFVIDPRTGASTQIGGTLCPAPAGFIRAIDFNPTVDRIRLVTSSGTNLRVNPDTGAVTVDGNLAFAAGDPNFGDAPAVVNAAYTNSFPGATATTLYDLEAGNNILAIQSQPDAGTLNTVGPLGFDIVSSAGFTGFDISGRTGNAYLVGNSLGGGGLRANSLYTVNLATGAATLSGPVSGVNGLFRDIAVANPVAVPVPGGLALFVGGTASLLLLRRRRG